MFRLVGLPPRAVTLASSVEGIPPSNRGLEARNTCPAAPRKANAAVPRQADLSKSRLLKDALCGLSLSVMFVVSC